MELVKDQATGISEKVEDVVARVDLIRNRLANQSYSVRLQHYWELENIRKCFREFKWRIEQLEDADDQQLSHRENALEAAWNELVNALNALLAVLP